MRTLQTCFMMLSIMTSCSEEPKASSDSQLGIDYYQFDEHKLESYGIDASIMIPNETAGIGASFECKIEPKEGFKWVITNGKNFKILIEDYGDYQYKMPEFIRKELEDQDIFKTEIIEQKENYVVYKRELNLSSNTTSSYHLYGIKYINGVYYEIKNDDEEGNTKKVIDFILKSFLSFKSLNPSI